MIEFEEQKKIVEELEKEKNNSLKLLEDQKKNLLDQQEQKKIFSHTYILYDESGVVKPTFVTELHQEWNIFSEFTIFYQKSDKNGKNFIKNNKKMFQLKKKLHRWKGVFANVETVKMVPLQIFFQIKFQYVL